jgi:hypothetical protein
VKRLAMLVVLGALIAGLRDPVWAGRAASGFRSWEEDPPGARFRWTAGRASFFVPADADAMTLPLRTEFAGPNGAPTEVEIRSDERYLATVRLPDLHVWLKTTLPLGGRASRRYRRIDLRVNRVVPPYMLGVMVGEVETATGGR